MMQDKLWKNLDDRESEAISGGQVVSLVLLFVNRSRSNNLRAYKINDYQIYR